MWGLSYCKSLVFVKIFFTKLGGPIVNHALTRKEAGKASRKQGELKKKMKKRQFEMCPFGYCARAMGAAHNDPQMK